MVTASIVTYNHNLQDIEPLLNSLSMSSVSHVYIIDHTEDDNKDFINSLRQYGKALMTTNQSVRSRAINGTLTVSYHKHENLGYGSGHNVAINMARQEGSKYHIVINPDVWFEGDIVSSIARYMDDHEDVGQIMPKVLFPDGYLQRLCKLLPTPWDMFSRLCLPSFINERDNGRYELKDSNYDKIMNVPYLSGCFMFFRMSSFDDVGLFDEHFFMYAEDIDMTRRMNEHYKTLFFPEVTIYHKFSRASRRSLRLFFIHTANIFMYFNKWGWFFDKKRRTINKATLESLGIK